ncbi:putative adenylate cyclase [Bradyrhizobium oligotrophicum S58]|uniref:Putative adenylate cyclase n=1 Tax=Bradyrhizobium oligotrophicum S58 TaxID=1245469 RepID=M4ZEL0_9BRAD|nr:adenylate/guanylate cyclase domain-containing protein [Bradyrhizobium oligotrophicum]BAM92248.1 putative adenylate cyclase [Bradyrhizobium oligotrophicum S58]
MECARCGKQNQPGRATCELCGEPLGLKCEACNHTNGLTNRFCGQCGSPLPGRLAPPDQTAQRVLRTLSSKGGERKRLTILFADIRGSTQLIDSLGDPELAMQRLDPVLNLMKEAVHRYDGVVNKTQGDGVMALFGAPVPHEDHAVRGCLGALAMQDSIARLADPHLQVRVGLHTGEVIVQVVENSMYQTYDAAGANVHLANRLEHMAEPGAILISKETYTGARQFVEAESLGTHTVRGIATPVAIYKLIGRLNAPASDVFRSGQRLLPLIGRNAQLKVLERELENVLAARGTVVGIVGDAGIGKSRLCFEFAESCRRQGIRVYEARVLAHGRATPFQPVLELLRDFFGIRAKEPVEVSRQRVVEKLEAIGIPDTALVLLLDFMSLADPTRPALRLDPGVFKTRLLNVFKTLFRSAPADAAAVIMIEDLHWVDEASEEFVEALAEATIGTKTLLVVNYRPGFAASFMQRAAFHELHIVPLASAETRELLRGVFGDDPSLEALAGDIVERAQGNPFFLEELASAVSESGGVEGERGAYRLKGGIGAIPLPPTVHAVVAARIDRLSETAKNVLETAAVIGRSVALAVLRPVTGLADAELFDALAQLRNADLLYDLPPFDMGVLAFRHPLIQEVAYSMQLRSRLSSVHVAVAKAIEALDWGSQDEFAALIASHYEFAGQTMQAVEHLQRAARWIGRTNTAESLRLWRKARSMLQTLPQSEHVDRMRALASAQILNCGWREGISAEEVRPFAEEAMRYARSSDKMHEPLVIGAYGRVLASTGAVDDYVNLVQNAVKLTSEDGDIGPYATVNAMLAQAFFMSGRLNEALSAVETAHAAIAEHGGFDSNVTLGLNPNQLLGFDIGYWIKCLKARILVQFGRFAEAEPLVAELLQADAEMAPVVRFIPHFASVEMAWARGHGDLLRRHAACVADVAEQSDMPYIRVLSLFGLSLSDAVADDLAAAVDRLHETIAFARRVKAALDFEARMLAGYADLLFRAGRLDEALDVSQQAIDLGRLRTDRIAELQGSLLRGLIRASSSALRDDGEARDLLERSERLLDVSAAGLYQPLLMELRSALERAR